MIESEVLAGYLHVQDFRDRVSPYLKEEYFGEPSWRLLYQLAARHVEKYETAPSPRQLGIALGAVPDVVPQVYEEACEHLKGLDRRDDVDLPWLLDETEKFCRDRAIYNAMRESLRLLEDEKASADRGMIPKMLEDALGVCFDTRIGHDYFEDGPARWEYFHNPVNKMPFGINMLNVITKGGVSRKSLSIFIAGTNVGKSHLMCHLAADHLMDGKNVLYISMEMAEDFVAQRIDMNLLDMTDEDLVSMSKEKFLEGINSLKMKTIGRLKVREYPNGTASAAHFRHLLHELKTKQKFVPDVIYIDYLGICASSRLKRGNVNSYEYYKSVAEELRALATQADVPIITAVQTNRSGYADADFDVTGTAESFGIPMTADLMVAVIETPELAEMNQLLFKQVKNRLGSRTDNQKFMVGIDRSKQRFYDLDNHSLREQEVVAAARVASRAKPVFNDPQEKVDPPDVTDFFGGSKLRKAKDRFGGFS